MQRGIFALDANKRRVLGVRKGATAVGASTLEEIRNRADRVRPIFIARSRPQFPRRVSLSIRRSWPPVETRSLTWGYGAASIEAGFSERPLFKKPVEERRVGEWPRSIAASDAA